MDDEIQKPVPIEGFLALNDFTKSVILLLIPGIISGVGIGVRYAFERGYCAYFNIPTDFITLDLADYLLSGFIAFVFVGILLVMGAIFIETIMWHAAIWVKFTTAIVLVCIVAAVIHFIVNRSLDINVFACVFIGITFGLAWRLRGFTIWPTILQLVVCLVGIFAFADFGNQIHVILWSALISGIVMVLLATLLPAEPVNKISSFRSSYSLLDKIVVAVCFLMLLSVIPAWVAYSVGQWHALYQVSFFHRLSEPNKLLVATYGENSIFVEVEQTRNSTYKLANKLAVVTSESLSGDSLELRNTGFILPASWEPPTVTLKQ